MACDDLDILSPDLRTYDGCPALNKLKVVALARTQVGTLEWTLRDRRGRTLDLSDADDLTVVLKLREAMSSSPEPLALDGTIEDGPNGVVRAVLTSEVSEEPGVLQGQWGLRCGDQLKFTESFYLLVEDGLFGVTAGQAVAGPPTLDELRAALMDYGAQNLLLRDVEFDDTDIAHAILRPVRYFNETPPPLGYSFTTTDFPPREMWTKAVIGELFLSAAHHYRRNQLAYEAGGISIDDKAKEVPYSRAGQELLEEWRSFVIRKKAGLNAQQFNSSVVSPYHGWA